MFIGGENRQAIRPLGPARRWLGQLVPNSAQILIYFYRLEAGWCWVLEILQHPQPATIVEGNRQRLSNFRLRCHKLDFETRGDLHATQRLLRRESLRCEMTRMEQCRGKYGTGKSASMNHASIR